MLRGWKAPSLSYYAIVQFYQFSWDHPSMKSKKTSQTHRALSLSNHLEVVFSCFFRWYCGLVLRLAQHVQHVAVELRYGANIQQDMTMSWAFWLPGHRPTENRWRVDRVDDGWWLLAQGITSHISGSRLRVVVATLTESTVHVHFLS